MRYLLLIAGEENARTDVSESEDTAILAEYGEWMKAMAERGVLQGGERLHPTADATTVRLRNGEVLSTDGPFAETKEQLGRLLPRRLQGPRRSDRGGGEDPRCPHRQHRGEADLGDVSPEADAALTEAFHAEWGRVIATLIRLTGDWDVAEECAQDAFAKAAERWPRDGVPRRPGAWLTTVARNRALDRVRRAQLGASKLQEVATMTVADDPTSSRRGRRRPASPHVHLLPPGPVVRGAGGLDAADPGGHDHAGDRPRLPRAGAHDGAAAGAGQEEDPQRRHPLPGAAGAPARRPYRRRARRALSLVQRGLCRHGRRGPHPAEPDRRGHPAGAHSCAASCPTSPRPSASSPSCCCTTPAGRPGSTAQGTSSSWTTRTAARGTPA